MRRITTFCVAVLLTLCSQRAHAENDGMISAGAIESVGLTVQWFNQLEVGPTGKVVDIQLDVNEDKATTFFATTFGNSRKVISQHHLNAFGKPMGIDGAEKYVNLRKEILEKELAAAGRKVEVKIEKFVLPKSTIYAMTDKGIVTAMDADTGEIHWTAEVGSRNLPSIGLGSSHDYVAAANGSSVYLLDAKDGKLIWERPCGGSIAASPAINENFVYVPLVDGPLKLLPLFKDGLGHSRFVSVGQSHARPLITSRTVSWPSDRGHYYVATKISENQISYRLRTERPIISSGAFLNGNLFVASMDGFIYSLEEFSGHLNWEFSTGDRISKAPIPLGDDIYVITEANDLFKINSVSGLASEGWNRPLKGIAKYVGSTKKNIYLQDKFGMIKIHDRQTGQAKGSFRASSTNLILENNISDRLYIGNQNGLIQCIREISSPRPLFHEGDMKMNETKKDKTTEEKGAVKPAAPASDDPFKNFGGGGKSDDPFKSGKDKAGSSDDPFGGGGSKASDDPFGGGGSTTSDDPFGG